jgi:formate dehydrogenase major subunit
LKPGTNILLLNAMAAAIVEERLFDALYVKSRVAGYADFAAFIDEFKPETVAAACGVDPAAIRAAARLYADTKPAMCFHGLGVTEHRQGTEGVMALINLALLTGNIGCRGGGINPLRGQNNVQGAAQMGCDPGSLTGGQPLVKAAKRFEAIWGSPIPDGAGLDLMQMMDAAEEGRLKAAWVIGYDIGESLPNTNRMARALENLDLVIVQDMFLNETARNFGTVFFPAASAFERNGTFMNSDRRVQRVRKAIAAQGRSKPDWWIIRALAWRMGRSEGFAFESAEDIWNEIRAVWPAGSGLSYARLESESLQWPCPETLGHDHPGTPILHAKDFSGAEKATLACIPYASALESPSEEYPFILVTGRELYHFNAGTMSYRTANADLHCSDELEMSAHDATRLKLEDGCLVRVSSKFGETTLPLRISPRVREGELFCTFHSAQLMVNRVTSDHRDRLANTPEYKVTAVRIASLDIHNRNAHYQE